MAQWGRNDKSVTVTTSTTKETSNGAPIGTYALVKAGGGNTAHQGNTNGTRANTDKNMFGNTTVGAFIPGKAVGVFGVDIYDVAANAGPLVDGVVTYAGSGYAANAAVTVTVTNGGTSGVVNAHANSCGRIDSILIQTAGSGYKTSPTITVAAPALVIFNGNSAVTGDSIAITTANSKFLVGDYITYAGNATSTPAPLVDGTKYYVVASNTSAIKISATKGGAPITLTDASGDNTTAGGATFRGETATGKVTVGGGKNNGIAHAGWVIRTEGTGGRAGRVHYETLVAMGSLGINNAKYGTAPTTLDASDDTVLPDA